MATITRTNLNPYPNLEAGLTGWTQRTVCTIAADTTTPLSGTRSLIATSSGTGFSVECGTFLQTIPVTIGLPYTASVLISALDNALPNTNVVIDWWNGGSYLSSTVGSAQNVSVGVPIRLSVTGNPPATATRLSMYVIAYNNTVGDRFEVDNAMIEQSSSMGTYFDGNSTGTTLKPYSWTGAANASPSIYSAILGDLDLDAAWKYYMDSIVGANTMSTNGLYKKFLENRTGMTNSSVADMQDTYWGGLANALVDLTTRSDSTYRTNVNVNPSAEVDSQQWNFWAGSTGTAALTREVSGGYVGPAFMRCTWSVGQSGAGLGGIFVDSPVTPGLPFSASIRARVSRDQKVRITVEWINAAKNANTGTAVPGPDYDLLANTWTELKIQNVIPPMGTAYLRVTVYGAPAGTAWNAGDYIDCDAIICENDVIVSPYYDGNSASSGETVYKWTGVSGSSASRKYKTNLSVMDYQNFLFGPNAGEFLYWLRAQP